MPTIYTPPSTSANSYITESEYVSIRDTYFTDTQRNASLSYLPDPLGADLTTLQRALITARYILDLTYRWMGRKTDPQQPLEWPRALVPYNGIFENLIEDYDPLTPELIPYLPNDAIPQEIKIAQALLVHQINEKFTSSDTAQIKQIAVEGAVKVVFRDNTTLSNDVIPTDVHHYARKYAASLLPSLNTNTGTKVNVWRIVR